MFAVVTPTKIVVPRTPRSTVPLTRGATSDTSTARSTYSDWTAWSCTESCGGCGIGRRTRTCLSASNACIDTTTEFNHESCNQHPCPFGKRICCGNYRLGQIEGHFACIP
uniref:TIL domain-containing protein n=1 Tax=Elaeophora elaphi TaxID=1147741 RepID=A0A0R3RFR0_9BILA